MKKIIYNTNIKKNVIDSEELYDINNHLLYIDKIYNNVEFIHRNYIENEIKKKYSSYIQQDKRKRKYNNEMHITYDELIYKLYLSNLSCYYCKCIMYLVYNNKNNRSQWSLERLNNDIGHYTNNTCISCLDCNLKRRTSNHEYYKKYKTIRIKKI